MKIDAINSNASFGAKIKIGKQKILNEIAKAVHAGAVRLGKSVWNRDVEVTACRNPDQSVSVLILNQAQKDLAVNLRISGFILQNVLLPARALSVIRLE